MSVNENLKNNAEEKQKRPVGRPNVLNLDKEEYYKEYYKMFPEKFYPEDKKKYKIQKATERYKSKKDDVLKQAADRYRKKKEEDYKAKHNGTLDGFKGVKKYTSHKNPESIEPKNPESIERKK